MRRFPAAQIPVGYPAANPELCLPELEGKTAKMYRLVLSTVLAASSRLLLLRAHVGGDVLPINMGL
jgi:hypothetical protein